MDINFIFLDYSSHSLEFDVIVRDKFPDFIYFHKLLGNYLTENKKLDVVRKFFDSNGEDKESSQNIFENIFYDNFKKRNYDTICDFISTDINYYIETLIKAGYDNILFYYFEIQNAEAYLMKRFVDDEILINEKQYYLNKKIRINKLWDDLPESKKSKIEIQL